ncbi:hypothetical protein AVEN_211888-1 [Araneus ventricosus]|uniref:Uncharacterized protein n=1 Tax=Araneus ventricosus TaxID=182803 RepID=A0A4Y2EYM5_ARAVE|nr:hypothetical protein AVEN_211888-1 [Araneus ventricosus]
MAAKIEQASGKRGEKNALSTRFPLQQNYRNCPRLGMRGGWNRTAVEREDCTRRLLWSTKKEVFSARSGEASFKKGNGLRFCSNGLLEEVTFRVGRKTSLLIFLSSEHELS